MVIVPLPIVQPICAESNHRDQFSIILQFILSVHLCPLTQMPANFVLDDRQLGPIFRQWPLPSLDCGINPVRCCGNSLEVIYWLHSGHRAHTHTPHSFAADTELRKKPKYSLELATIGQPVLIVITTYCSLSS